MRDGWTQTGPNEIKHRSGFKVRVGAFNLDIEHVCRVAERYVPWASLEFFSGQTEIVGVPV